MNWFVSINKKEIKLVDKEIKLLRTLFKEIGGVKFPNLKSYPNPDTDNKRIAEVLTKEINFILGYLIGTESHLKRNGKLTANDKIQINNYRVLLDNLIEQFEYEYGRKTKLSRTLESLKKRYDKIEKILIK